MASPRKTKRYWSEEESELLRKSVAKYGGHKWSQIIKNEPVFQKNGRTQVDLKDRWRNMNRRGKSKSPAKSSRDAQPSKDKDRDKEKPPRRSRSPSRKDGKARSRSRSRSKSPERDSEIVIYTIANCGYCHDIKEYLNKNRLEYKETRVTNSNKEAVYKKTDPLTKSYRYFPMVFIDGRFKGGYTEFKKMYGMK